MGIQILDRLEKLHSLGYTHRDIKPDNMLLDTDRSLHEETMLGYEKVYLIDFGRAKKYLDEDGKHILNEQTIFD